VIEAATLRLDRPADPAELRTIRTRVTAWAHAQALPEDVLTDLQLAVGEAVANGVEHAYANGELGTVEVELTIRTTAQRASAVRVRVVDHGHWRPMPAGAGYRGRGLTLIGRLADGLQVVATRSGTQVCFEVPIPGRRADRHAKGGVGDVPCRVQEHS